MVLLQYDIVSVIEKPASKLSEKEIRSLAEYTHDNWFAQRKELGWKFGDFMMNSKTDPKMVSWENLTRSGNSRSAAWWKNGRRPGGSSFKVEYLTCR